MQMLNGIFQLYLHAHPAAVLAAFPIPADVFWLYFAAIVLFAIGLTIIIKNELPQKHGLDKILPFGRLFYAIPMAVFGTEHLVDAPDIAQLVPSWMPAHLFWTYLVGVALISAALSIIFKRCPRLAATLLGIMLSLFVAMIPIPAIVAQPRERLFWVLALRDLSFAGGAFAFAGSQMQLRRTNGSHWLVTLGRFIIGTAAVVFGVEQFLHPTLVPGVPLNRVTPAWIPGHIFWTYLSGAVLVATGACILINVKARLAATYLGIMILLLMLFIYLPILIAEPLSIANGLNYFFDTLVFGGAALVLADAIGEGSRPTPGL